MTSRDPAMGATTQPQLQQAVPKISSLADVYGASDHELSFASRIGPVALGASKAAMLVVLTEPDTPKFAPLPLLRHLSLLCDAVLRKVDDRPASVAIKSSMCEVARVLLKANAVYNNAPDLDDDDERLCKVVGTFCTELVAAAGSTAWGILIERIKLSIASVFPLTGTGIDVTIMADGRTERTPAGAIKKTVSLLPAALLAVRTALLKMCSGPILAAVLDASIRQPACAHALVTTLNAAIGRLESQPLKHRAPALPLIEAMGEDAEHMLATALQPLGFEDNTNDRLALAAASLLAGFVAASSCDDAAAIGVSPTLQITEVVGQREETAHTRMARELVGEPDATSAVAHLLSTVEGIRLVSLVIEEDPQRKLMRNTTTSPLILHGIDVEVKKLEQKREKRKAQEADEGEEEPKKKATRREEQIANIEKADKVDGGFIKLTEPAAAFLKGKGMSAAKAWHAKDHLDCQLAGYTREGLLKETTDKYAKDQLKQSGVGGHTASSMKPIDRMSVHWAWREIQTAKEASAS